MMVDAATMQPTSLDSTVTDSDLNIAARRILAAHAAGHITDLQAAHALWSWASQAALIEHAVRTTIRRRSPQHANTSTVTDALRVDVHDTLRRKLVDQFGTRGGFDPTHPGNFAGWVRAITCRALAYHCQRVIEAQTRQVPVDSQETHPLDLLNAHRGSSVAHTATGAEDPLDIITAGETSLGDLHADVWADVTVMAQENLEPEHHPLLARQVYSASYQVPPPARPLDPADRRRVRTALATRQGQMACVKALNEKTYPPSRADTTPTDHSNTNTVEALFRALWAPLGALDAARLVDGNLARWYAEAVTYLLPYRGERPYKRFLSAVKRLGATDAERDLLGQMAASWAAVEVEAYSPKWKRGTDEARQRRLVAAHEAAAVFEDTLREVTTTKGCPLGGRRRVALRHLRRIGVETGFVADNPLMAHPDLGKLVRRVLSDCRLAG